MSTSHSFTPCPHFGSCGGCQFQDTSTAEVQSHKLAVLIKALTANGVIAREVRPMMIVQEHARRRITLAAIGTREGVVVGFHASHSKDVVPIHSCLVAQEHLISLIPHIKTALENKLNPRENLDIHILQADNGVDITVTGECLKSPEIATRIFEALKPVPCIRLSVGDALQLVHTLPMLNFGVLGVTPPPAPFVQACAEAETFMQKLVLEAMGKKAKNVADLFAGIGTFTGVLAGKMRVQAYENNVPAVAALSKAIKHASGIKPCSIEDRDLFRRPLVKHELADFDAVVLNPARQGAQAQVEWLAKSAVPNIAYVSCSPASFARDAAVLCKAGYQLQWLQPIDQFLWSEHLEIVAAFRK